MDHSGPSSLTVLSEEKPVSLPSWEAEAVLDYGKSYAQKYSAEFRDDQATVWTSMYEKNLGRKVSQLPPWEVATRKESEERVFGNPFKKDLASVHKERAEKEGKLHYNKNFPNHPMAEHQREKRRAKRRSASASSTTSTESESAGNKQ